MSVQIITGDCRKVLAGMPEASVDSCVTDPPYGLGFMGKGWDRGVPGVDFWSEVYRVLKPGAHLLAFGGTRTHHRMVCAIEDAGFEIRDEIDWLYGSGFPKSLNLDGEWQGWGTAIKPAKEPVCVARKPLEKGLTVAQNVAKWGTGAFNIDGCRVPTDENQSRRRGAFPHSDDAWGNGRENEVSVSHDLGRWPANVVHDGSDEVLAAFPHAPGAVAPVTGKEPSGAGFSGNVYGAPGTQGRQPSDRRDGGGSAARFFYCAKASKSERGEGNTHPTVKPIALMRWLIRLVTPPGGHVLDPFAGSGTTGLAAALEQVNATLIELDPKHVAIIQARLRHQDGEAPLFAAAAE